MKIYLSPQVSDRKIEHDFDGEKVIITIDDKTDVFDFSNLREGDEIENIETILPINPINEVYRKNGVLYVELINFISEDATEEERFPVWKEV